jgi:hypothetical protein
MAMLEKAEHLDLKERARTLAAEAEQLRREVAEARRKAAEADWSLVPVRVTNQRLEAAIETLEKLSEATRYGWPGRESPLCWHQH